MKLILITIFFGFSINTHASFRLININKEIANASFCSEVIFTGYDSIKVPYYSSGFQRVLFDSITGKEIPDTNYVDSTYIMTGINYLPYLQMNAKTQYANCNSIYSWIRYKVRPETLPKKAPSHGFWPKLNDTCLVIIDESGFISTFAIKSNGNYIFWDPIL